MVFKKKNQCRQIRVNSFMNAQIVKKYCVRNLEIVASIVRTVQFVVQVNRKTKNIVAKVGLQFFLGGNMKTIGMVSVLVLFAIGCGDEGTQSSTNSSTREVYGVLIKKATIVDKEITLSVDCIVPDPSYGYSHTDTFFTGNMIYLTIYTRPINQNGAVQILWSFKEDIKINVPTAGEYTIHYRHSHDEMRDTMFTIN